MLPAASKSASRALLVLLVGSSCLGQIACGGGGQRAGGRTGQIQVVAAENFWADLARQVGGQRAVVRDVLSDPNTDPHEYESTPADARAFAAADLVILNGAGYDAWAGKLVAANPNPARRVLNIAQLLGRRVGDNPHFWYDPSYVSRAVQAMASDLEQIDPAGRSYFESRAAATLAAFAPENEQIRQIRAQFAGQMIGSTESVFVPLARALGLNLISSASFMNAMSAGTDPPASAVIAFQNQISSHLTRLLVYNLQTPTTLASQMRALAEREGIPVVAVTETMPLRFPNFEAWQGAQLGALATALQTGPRAG